jgi:hypothetical protein
MRMGNAPLLGSDDGLGVAVVTIKNFSADSL